MKRKILHTLTAASLACLCLTACQSSSPSSAESGSSAPSAPSSSAALSVAIWDGGQQPGLAQIMEDFTAQTGIAVDLQVVPWDQYWTLLEAGVMGNTLPDVFWMHSNYSQKFMANDVLLDLTDLIADSSIDLTNYYSDVTELYQYDGRTYAIPKDYDTIALWYNKTMFDEAGLAYPDETWTWQTLADVSAKLTKEDGSQYGFASPAAFNQDGYYNIIYDNGASVLNEEKTASMWDSPETIAVMNWWYDNLVTVSMPTQQIMSENTPDVLMGSGTVAMTMQGSWMVNTLKQNDYVKENCDVAVLPMAEDGTRKSIVNGLGWAAAAGNDHTEEAWQLLQYLGSKEAQEKQAQLGVTMSAYMGTSETWINSAPEFNLQAYLDMSQDMVVRPYTKNTKAWEDYSQQTMVKAYTGEMTMEDACKDIASFMNAQIAQE